MRAGGERVFVAVGANLGDREATFAAVVRALEREPDLLLLAYLNAVIALQSWLSPSELLARLQRIEARFGRDRSQASVRWGPRTLDLDLILYGERVIDLPELVVPHPRAHERAFVLMPLVELCPTLVHPRLGVTIGAIAASLRDTAGVRPARSPQGWPGAAERRASLSD
jgi:7,8-dihydro-6-hydroxymethylpterin-pyrophosphokinase